MLRVLKLLLLAVVCTACKQADRDEPAPANVDERARPAHVTPKVAYEHACADCHETGKDGAPRFNMPPHGHDGRFTDDEVAAAAQYMLEITHPDRPRD
jgi:cytochrome c5